MADRHERNLYEGPDRRISGRRKDDRRKFEKVLQLVKYVAVAIVVVVLLALFR